MGETGAVDGMRLLDDLVLSRGRIDRAAERRADDDWLAAAWSAPTTHVLVVSDGRVPVDEGHSTVRWSAAGDVDQSADRYLLGASDDEAWFAVAAELPPGESAGLRELGPLLEDDVAGLVVHAIALANWHVTHQHCPRCGARTVITQAGHVRRCPADGSDHFPRTDPAIIVLVTDEHDRALLGRGAEWPAGRFSTLAGFVEPGESLEQAIRREIHEESGVVVGATSYAGSQPWPFPASLMLGFFARAEQTEITVDGVEVAEAAWFSRDDLAAAVRAGELLFPGSVSISRKLIEAWYGRPLPEPS